MNEKGMVLPFDGLKNATYGGFAAALKNWKLPVMNVVPNDFSVTLPISYERGLSGIYHDWCNIVAVIAEGDRILRPERYFLIERIRDNAETLDEIKSYI